MATGKIHFRSLEEETEHSEKVYKAIANSFIKLMPAVQLMEQTVISAKLTTEEMQKVQKKQELEGGYSAARLLLVTLKMKPYWFEAFMEVLDDKDLKLQEFKKKFMDEKAKVDEEWIKTHLAESHTAVCNPSRSLEDPGPPTQSSEETGGRALRARAMDIDCPSGGASGGGTVARDSITDDFSLPATPAPTPALGLQRDAVLESMEVDMTNDKSNTTTTTAPASSETQVASAQALGAEVDEQYTDASSTAVSTTDSIYEPSQPVVEDEHEYTQLANVCLEMDACPMPAQVSEVPQQEVGVEEQPQILTPQETQHRRRQRPQTREEHPSLCQAISREPAKDFEAGSVIQELSSIQGWSSRNEEHKVIHIIRPHRHTDGYYVVWYWSLAKRPTVCVAQGGRVITFVVHKSSSRPITYYINRHQKRCKSVRELLEYHFTNGIQYCPQRGQETTVWLTHPYRRM